jgi:hypothetical protein
MPKRKGTTKRKYPPRRSKKQKQYKHITSNPKLNILIPFQGGAGHVRSLPRDPYRFSSILDSSPFIYSASDYLSSLTPDNMVVFQRHYAYLVQEAVIKSLTTFGFSRAGGSSEIETEYTQTFLNIPVCWQEIIIMLYLALKLHRVVENNSRVVCLGESPSKLVFIQEVLAIHPSYKPVLEKHGFATNVEYSFFPASGLSPTGPAEFGVLDTSRDLSACIRDIDATAMVVNGISFGAYPWEDVLSHFKLFKLDPLSIITEGKNVYIQDRCESYSSVCKLIIFYNKMCHMQEISQDQRLQLFERLYIIGFDIKVQDDAARNQTGRLLVERLNIFFYQLITKQPIDPTPDKCHFIQKNYRSLKNNIEDGALRSNGFNIFTNQHYLLIKVLLFLTTPENAFNDARCVRSCSLKERQCVQKIKKKYDKNGGEFHIKQPGPTGKNCNMVNFCLMMFINELGDTYLDNLILSLETINEDILFYSNDHTFDTLNDEISEVVNQQTYNSNILNNILSTKEVIEKISEKIDQFLKRDGLFSPCRYMPFTFQKKRPNKGKSRRRSSAVRRFNSSH